MIGLSLSLSLSLSRALSLSLSLTQGLEARGAVIYPGKLTEAECFRLGNIGAHCLHFVSEFPWIYIKEEERVLCKKMH